MSLLFAELSGPVGMGSGPVGMGQRLAPRTCPRSLALRWPGSLLRSKVSAARSPRCRGRSGGTFRCTRST